MKKKGGVEIISPKIVKPSGVKIQTIRAEKRNDSPVFPKMEILTEMPLPDGHVRCEVLQDYKGMIDELYTGDIIDLPERRYKSLSFRGLVKEYTGKNMPNKRR